MFARALSIVLLSSLLSSSLASQLLRDGAYGLTPEQVESGELPPGWIRLDGPDQIPQSGPIVPVLDDCSIETNEESLNYVPWPGGVVPFEFNANVTLTNQNRVLAAFAILEGLADLVFVPRAGEPDFLHIRSDTVNRSSSIGYAPGQTTIRISSWTTQGIIIHEFLHALGFYHEQARPDQVTFIDLFPANMQAGQASQFALQPGSLRVGPYDYGSLMQYGPCSFSTNCLPNGNCNCAAGTETILPTPPFAAFRSQMGQRAAMSPLDVHALRSLHPYGHWRFVEADHPFAGDGSGLNPWNELSAARTGAPSGARVFVLPGTYDAAGVWSTPLVLDAPIGGAVME